MASTPADPDNKLGMFENVKEVKEKYAQQLSEIRSLLTEGEEADDVVVYRYLRGYKFNVANAAAALNKTKKFRRENGCDEIRKKAANIEQMQFPFADRVLQVHPHNVLHGYDKKGQPLSLERIGHAKPSLLKKILTHEQLMEYHLSHMENKAALVARLSEETNTVVRTAKILDLDGLSMKLMDPAGIQLLLRVLSTSQDHYPEMLGRLYIINAPFVFQAFWKVIKPILQPATLEKINILGSDWKEVLRANIDEKYLPEWAGGTCKCPEGCIVERQEGYGLTEAKIDARDKLAIEQPVEAARTVVSWEFRTESNDIGFAATFQSQNGEAIPVAEHGLVSSHAKIITGEFEAPAAGVLKLTFDNSHSRWTSKKLFYKVEQVVLPPEETSQS